LLTQAFGGIASRARPAAEPVGGGELLGDGLNFQPCARRLSEIARRDCSVEFPTGFSQPLLVLRRGTRIENRSEVTFHAHGPGAVRSPTASRLDSGLGEKSTPTGYDCSFRRRRYIERRDHEIAADTAYRGHDKADEEDRQRDAKQEPINRCESSRQN
jgi:hypothetical protein